MLRVTNLEAGYGKLRVLKNVSLHVGSGEIVILLGANGSGKSTLLKTASGILRPQGGRVLFDRQDIAGAAMERIVELGCVLVPEGRQLFNPLSVRENLLLGAYLHARRSDRVRESLEEVFSLFPRLAERQAQLAGTLSGGEQQMLAIGRALMARPKMIMMDEPSMGLAPMAVDKIFQTLAQLPARGITVLLVEQNARASLAIASRGYVLETGQIVLEGSSLELMDNHDVRRAYLGKDYKRIEE
ncbi:MAG: branched-chain amino acid ABC transporter ATP-binding protein [Spirochaetes bacterium RBG_16_67_19]|nr:MAG: branched-chain amino acid ABC transporter ATP-binding protein [Spirochaetes bacterium RBG_16_67_19]